MSTASAGDVLKVAGTCAGVQMTNGLTINNVAPVLDAISNQTITETETLTFTITASDGNGDALTYGLSNPESGMTLDNTGLFTWTPGSGSKGLYTVTVVVTDTGGLTDSTTVLITVKGPLPILTMTKTVELSGSSPALPGDPISYTVVISKSGGDAENMSLTDTLPSGLSGDTLTWSGTLTSNTVLTFTYKATLLNIPANYTATITNTAYLYHTSGNLNAVATFETISDTTPPGTPTLLTPTNGSLITDTNIISFSWSSVTDSQSGLDYYTLQVDSSNDGLSIQTSLDSTTTQSSYTPTNALANGVYTWTVKAHDMVGNVSNSLTSTFTLSTTTISTDTTIYLPIVIMSQDSSENK